MEYSREEEMRKPVRQYFENKEYRVFDEINLFARKIDVVAKRKNEVIAIELKLRNWRRAISQACLNLRVSNFSFVALPESLWDRINTRIYAKAYEYGVGLLSVNGEARQLMRPKRSRRIQPLLRKKFLIDLKRKAKLNDF